MKKYLCLSLVCISTNLLANNFYLGVQAGYDDYETKSHRLFNEEKKSEIGTLYYSGDPSVSSQGIQGGIFVGYNLVKNKYNLGLELTAATTSAKHTNQYTLSVPSEFSASSHESAIVQESFAIGILPGYQVSNSALAYIRIAAVNTFFKFYDDNPAILLAFAEESGIGHSLKVATNDNLWGGRIGIGSQYQINSHLALRGEYNYTYYQTATGNNSINTSAIGISSMANFTPSSNQFVFGLIYQFS